MKTQIVGLDQGIAAIAPDGLSGLGILWAQDYYLTKMRLAGMRGTAHTKILC
jgi:hypothetical protein